MIPGRWFSYFSCSWGHVDWVSWAQGKGVWAAEIDIAWAADCLVDVVLNIVVSGQACVTTWTALAKC